MHIQITAKPQFSLTPTREQLNLLIRMSEMHYDHTCKMMSVGRGTGAPVNGLFVIWDHSITMQEENPEHAAVCHATFRDLDLVLKVCENHSILNPEERKEVWNFTAQVSRALDLANKQVHVLEWNLGE
jgi:hypothetical protein